MELFENPAKLKAARAASGSVSSAASGPRASRPNPGSAADSAHKALATSEALLAAHPDGAEDQRSAAMLDRYLAAAYLGELVSAGKASEWERKFAGEAGSAPKLACQAAGPAQ